MATTNPGSRRSSYVQTIIQHSSKIYEFFGLTPGNTPPLTGLIGRDTARAQNCASCQEDLVNAPDHATTTDRSASNAIHHTRQVNGTTTGSTIGAMKPPPLVIRKKPSRRRTCCRALVQDFGPSWFTFSMDTALLALLVQLLPTRYRPDFLKHLSTALLVLSLVLFLITLVIILIRILHFRLTAIQELVSVEVEVDTPTTPQTPVKPPPQSLVSPAGTSIFTISFLPIALLTLVAAATMHATTLPMLHPGLPIALYSVFWVGVALTVVIALLTLTTLFAHPHPGRRTAPGRYLRPLTLLNCSLALGTVSVPGGLLVSQLVPIGALSPRLAPQPIVLSLLLLGASFLLASAAYAVLLHELLLVTGWPSPQYTPMMLFLVAPPGQGAAGLLLLGEAVMVAGPRDGMRRATAEAVNVVCVVLGLLLLGMAVVWLFLGVVGTGRVIAQARNLRGTGEERWGPLWNGVMFPVGTLALAAARLGAGLDDKVFGMVAVVLVVCCAVGWVVNLGFTVAAVVRGRVLIVRNDPREGGEV